MRSTLQLSRRTFGRRTAILVTAALASPVVMGGGAGAETLTVACEGPGGGGAGLVSAIDQANATAGADTIDLVPGCAYVLTAAASPDTGLPVVTGQLAIQGHGATIRRSGSAPRFRIFEVAASGELGLDEVTVTDGVVALSGPLALGGGILNSGLLTVTDSSIRNNEVRGSGSSAGGGGIANNGTVILRDTVLRDNRARATGTQIFSAVGGAVLNRTGATMTIEGSTIAENRAVSRGETGPFFIAAAGGIGNTGTLSVNDTRIVGNRAVAEGPGGQASGGGMSVADGTVTVTGGDLQGNTAVAGGEGAGARGGGLENSGRTILAGVAVRANRASGPLAQGGGIFNGARRLTIVDGTITENVASASSGPGQGGGIFVDGGGVVLRSTRVVANRPDDCEPALPGC